MGVSNEPKPMGVALIGAGMIAKSHILALSAASNEAQLHAIVSRRPERTKPLAVHTLFWYKTFVHIGAF